MIKMIKMAMNGEKLEMKEKKKVMCLVGICISDGSHIISRRHTFIQIRLD